jgi:predicted acetyltransferase
MPDEARCDLSVVAAGEADRSIICNLIQLYLYDMASQNPFPLNEQGLYDYDYLDGFWQAPYLFRAGADLVGFALVVGHSPISNRAPCWFMAEFCVLRPYRRKGLGRLAVADILGRHQGAWEIAWQTENRAAASFWPSVLRDRAVVSSSTAFDDADWYTMSFAMP